MLLGAAILAVAIVALLGAAFGQSFLNMSARNLTLGMNDATRVMEEMRQQNVGSECTTPSALPPPKGADPDVRYDTWDAWLEDPARGKNMRGEQLEKLAISCQNQDGKLTCGPNQVSGSEWATLGDDTNFDPIRVTVAAGWRQQQRAMGGGDQGLEFKYEEGTSVRGPDQEKCILGGKACWPVPGQMVKLPPRIVADDTDNDGVVESQAMLTTFLTCR